MSTVRMAKKEAAPRQRAWQAMRILPRWTLGDLESTAEISRSNAESFVYALVKAGYVRCVQPRKSGVKGGYAVYRLIKNTGVRSPVTANYNAVIHDRNTGQDTIIHVGEGLVPARNKATATRATTRDRATTRVAPTPEKTGNHHVG